MSAPVSRSENLTAVLFMTLAMALFATADAFIKVVSQTISTGQVLALMGFGGALIFGAMIVRADEDLFPSGSFNRVTGVRLTAEVIGTIGFTSALAIGNLAVVSSILQATPLAVTAAAALALNERVGARRWAAVAIGFVGVLLIVQPGLDGLDIASLLALVGMAGLSVRDVMTRLSPKTLSSRQLAFHSFAILGPVGVAMMWLTDGWHAMTIGAWSYMLGVICFAVAAYYAVTTAMRMGDLSFVTPFRYSRIIFALIIGIFVFAEPVDYLTAIGMAIVIASGLYSMWREGQQRKSES